MWELPPWPKPILEKELAAIPTRVREGVLHLDLHARDWRQRVNPNTLNMRKVRDSILGQSFDDLFEAYAMHDEPLRELGFAPNVFMSGADRQKYLTALQEAWVKEISKK